VSEKKSALYEQCRSQVMALVEGEKDVIARMASLVGVLHNAMAYYFWTGFYRVDGDRLVIGPYQGAIGCLEIAFGLGVCGTAAETRETQLVEDVHAFPGHIACDARSRSEIVVPVFAGGELIAVLDVDSDQKAAFDQVDQLFLEELIEVVFS